jgi:putative peptide zinc metalloprotease protein
VTINRRAATGRAKEQICLVSIPVRGRDTGDNAPPDSVPVTEPVPEPSSSTVVEATGIDVGGKVPCRIPEVELLGEYEGSGYVQPHYLVRRPDQQVAQVTRLLYLVLSSIDGRRSTSQIADRVSAELGRPVSAGNVDYLIEHKLAPLGLAADSDQPMPITRTHHSVLSLAVRRTLMPPFLVNRIADVLKYLFLPVVVLEALNAWLVMDYWLISHTDQRQVSNSLVAAPDLMLVALGLGLLSMVFHELGHASGCRYGGGRPGQIGMGVYLIWPALYTNVTDAYRLDRRARLRTDLGGIYFNVIFILGLGAAYLATSWPPFLVAVLLGHIGIFQQLLPIVRLDGYFILSDLVGVPDLFAFMGPILRGLIPGRTTGERALSLTRRVRVLVRIWALATGTVIVVSLVALAIRGPGLIRGFLSSWAGQLQAIQTAVGTSDWPATAKVTLALITLCIPVVGLTITLGRAFRQLCVRCRSRTAVRLCCGVTGHRGRSREECCVRPGE